MESTGRVSLNHEGMGRRLHLVDSRLQLFRSGLVLGGFAFQVSRIGYLVFAWCSFLASVLIGSNIVKGGIARVDVACQELLRRRGHGSGSFSSQGLIVSRLPIICIGRDAHVLVRKSVETIVSSDADLWTCHPPNPPTSRRDRGIQKVMQRGDVAQQAK